MPDRDFDRKQGRFLLIMNEIADKLSEYKITQSESQLLWAVIRRTWGYKGKAWAVIKWDTLLKATKLCRSTLSEARQKLIARNILHTKPGNKPKSIQYKINSKVSTWVEPEDLVPTWRPTRYRPQLKLVRPGEPNCKDELVRPGEPTSFAQANQLVRPGEPVPIKKHLLKDISLKHTEPSVCVDEKTTVFLTSEVTHQEGAKMVIDCLNDLSGKGFSYSDDNLDPIVERFEDGATVDDCITVCTLKWEDTTFQNQYYRPSTLFKKGNFENYLNSQGKKRKPSTKQEARRLRNAEVFQRRQRERQEKARREESPGEN